MTDEQQRILLATMKAIRQQQRSPWAEALQALEDACDAVRERDSIPVLIDPFYKLVDRIRRRLPREHGGELVLPELDTLDEQTVADAFAAAIQATYAHAPEIYRLWVADWEKLRAPGT